MLICGRNKISEPELCCAHKQLKKAIVKLVSENLKQYWDQGKKISVQGNICSLDHTFEVVNSKNGNQTERVCVCVRE